MNVSSLTCASLLFLSLSGLITNNRQGVPRTRIETEIRSKASAIGRPEARVGIPVIQANEKLTSKEGRFSITLPPKFAPFQYKTQMQPTDVGNIEVHAFNSLAPQGACVLAYSDYPPVSFEGRSAEEMLGDGRDGALKSVNGTLEKQKSITVQEYPGLSVYGSAGSSGKQFYFRFDYVLVKPRLYQIGYLAYDKADLDNPEVQSFFRSFRLEDLSH